MPLPILYSAKQIERQFNTGEQPVSTDTIICSDIFAHLAQDIDDSEFKQLTERLNKEYDSFIHQCKLIHLEITEDIPQEWNVPQAIIMDKISQLFDEKWVAEVWNNFVECLNENINHE